MGGGRGGKGGKGEGEKGGGGGKGEGGKGGRGGCEPSPGECNFFKLLSKRDFAPVIL